MTTIHPNRFATALVGLILAAAASTGCSTPKIFSLDSSWPFRDDQPKAEIPTRVAGVWTDTVLHKGSDTPQRGFGGRLMFYGKDPEKPVPVDGELVVYAFDETGRDPTDNKPTRRYVFPADQLPLRMSESPIGPSYSFFLPWDEAGGPQTEVSLICRFQPKGGPVVLSEQTKHLLPGTLPSSPADVAGYTTPNLPKGVPSRPAFPSLSGQPSNAPSAPGVRQAGYQVAPNTTDSKRTPSQMTTTSIPLPRDFHIPQGVTPTPMKMNSTAPAARQVLPPNQPSVLEQTTQSAVPASGSALPPAVSGQRASETVRRRPSATGYLPPRLTTPAVYNPMFGSLADRGIGQPLQVPPINTVAPPMVGPLVVPQQARVPQQTVTMAPTNTGGTIASSGSVQQSAPQMMQIPTSGTATVTYR
jgi:hypothetical protein